MESFTKSSAAEFSKRNIKINCVSASSIISNSLRYARAKEYENDLLIEKMKKIFLYVELDYLMILLKLLFFYVLKELVVLLVKLIKLMEEEI